MQGSPTPVPNAKGPQPTLGQRVRARIEALKRLGPIPQILGTGAASNAGRDLRDRGRRIDEAVEDAQR